AGPRRPNRGTEACGCASRPRDLRGAKRAAMTTSHPGAAAAAHPASGRVSRQAQKFAESKGEKCCAGSLRDDCSAFPQDQSPRVWPESPPRNLGDVATERHLPKQRGGTHLEPPRQERAKRPRPTPIVV